MSPTNTLHTPSFDLVSPTRESPQPKLVQNTIELVKTAQQLRNNQIAEGKQAIGAILSPKDKRTKLDFISAATPTSLKANKDDDLVQTATSAVDTLTLTEKHVSDILEQPSGIRHKIKKRVKHAKHAKSSTVHKDSSSDVSETPKRPRKVKKSSRNSEDSKKPNKKSKRNSSSKVKHSSSSHGDV